MDAMDPAAMKVPELKAELTKRGMDTKGLKADLSARLQSVLQEETEASTALSSAGVAPSEEPLQKATTVHDSVSVKKEAVSIDPIESETSAQPNDQDADSAFVGDDISDESSDSDSEEDDAVIVITGDSGGAQPSKKRVYERGSNTYVRPDAFTDDDVGEGQAASVGAKGDDNIDKLRFSYRLTAFDTDVDEGVDQPWRKQRTDISDFFNYGLTEATWKVYCAKQLRYRAQQGLGPNESNSAFHSS